MNEVGKSQIDAQMKGRVGKSPINIKPHHTTPKDGTTEKHQGYYLWLVVPFSSPNHPTLVTLICAYLEILNLFNLCL